MNDEQPRRPTAVTAAYWLWFLAAAASLIASAAWLTADAAVIEATRGSVTDPAGLATLLRVLGAIALASALLIAVLVRFVRRGDPRFRRTLVVFSGVLAVFYIGMIGIVGVYGLIVAVPCLVAAVLVYRPSAQPWFAR